MPSTRRAHDRRRFPRLARELATLRAMAGIYCRDHHGTAAGGLCPECRVRMDYATRRLDRCVFGDDKPTCANCKVHCYTPARREEVRVMMRYAGPRMMWRHPVLALAHIADGRREAPELPRPPGKDATSR
jgi:predicted amidophosphoribosyltransferase